MTKLRAWLASAKCFVVIFFRPAILVAPAPNMSCEVLELKVRRTSVSADVAIPLIDGMLAMSDRKVSTEFKSDVTEETRMKRDSSI